MRAWVLDEGGEGKWGKEALVDMVGPWKEPVYDEQRRVRRRFLVPPTFRTFLGSGEEDPFAEDGGRPTVMELLKRNGVSFREGDSVVYYEQSSVLEVVASQLAVELIDGIIGHGSHAPLRMIRGSVVLVESKEKLTRESVAEGRYRIRQKVTQYSQEGLGVEVRLGRRMKLGFEGWVDSDERVVEMRYDLESKLGGLLKSGGVFAVGRPVIVQQMKVGKKWRAWVLTASVLRLRDFLEDEE